MTKRFFAAIMSVAVFAALAPVAGAQSQCPAEVGQAQTMLQKVSKVQDVQAPRSLAGARQDPQAPRTTQDVQAPRSLAGARQQDVQAPRSSTQDVQAPRSSTQDVQAPRSSTQDVQAPRSSTQDVQAPRSIAGAKASGGDAIKLVREAEAACKAGKMDTAKAKAIEAIGLMK